MSTWWLLPAAVMLVGSVSAGVSVRRAMAGIVAVEAQLASIGRAQRAIGALAVEAGSIRSQTDMAGDAALVPGHR